jgi:hypothetical protein
VDCRPFSIASLFSFENLPVFGRKTGNEAWGAPLWRDTKTRKDWLLEEVPRVQAARRQGGADRQQAKQYAIDRRPVTLALFQKAVLDPLKFVKLFSNLVHDIGPNTASRQKLGYM